LADATLKEMMFEALAVGGGARPEQLALALDDLENRRHTPWRPPTMIFAGELKPVVATQ